MAVLIFWLFVLVALGNFADFLLGQSGGRRAKDRLVDFYILVNNDNWNNVSRWTGRAMQAFMLKYLGKPWSTRYFIRVLLFSLITSTILGLYLMIDPSGGANETITLIFVGSLLKNLLPFWISGYVVDLISWYFAYRAFARLAEVRAIGAILATIALATLAYVSMIINLFMLFITTFLLFPSENMSYGTTVFIQTILVTIVIVSSGLFDMQNGIPYFVTILPALVPHASFAVILIICIFAALSQRFLQGPLSVILQRAEESAKGIFTLGATVIASVIGILSAAERAVN